MGPALEMPLEALQAMLRVNVEGVFIVSRAVLPHMIARRSGSVVNLASWAGKTGNAYFAGYSASKFAVIGLTQALAREMAPHGIRVNAICPGIVVDTAMRTAIEAQQRQYGLPETAEREKSIPIGRVSVPDDVARVAAFLASDESSYMTGEFDQSLRRLADGLKPRCSMVAVAISKAINNLWTAVRRWRRLDSCGSGVSRSRPISRNF